MSFEHEQRFRAIIENAWDVFAIFDEAGVVQYASPSNARVLGYSSQDMLGRDALSFVHPDDLPQARAALSLARSQPGTPIPLEHRLRHRNGSWRMMETIVQNLLHNPAVRGIIAHSQDVTERNILHAELQQAQLQMLRMQIQPHFIFNILNSIHMLVTSSPEKADEMLVQFGDLLRLSFKHAHKQKIPLKHELDFVKRYVDVEQIRFPERLTVSFHLDPGAEEALVPNLMLQPLVENAIRHGFAQRAGGTLTLFARRTGDRLYLYIEDDGAGLSEAARLEEGIGLSNTRTRLQRLYGKSSRFVLRSLEQGGLRIQIELPFQTSEPHLRE